MSPFKLFVTEAEESVVAYHKNVSPLIIVLDTIVWLFLQLCIFDQDKLPFDLDTF